MARSELKVEVSCGLTVSRETAETCLKLVEHFLNTNIMFAIQSVENEDGTISLYLVDVEGLRGHNEQTG